jgi:hypothetical protein
MVRAAVRMLTINVYTVGDPAMIDFVASSPCSHYFNEVALHLANHALHFDRHLEAVRSGACFQLVVQEALYDIKRGATCVIVR